MIVRVRLDGPNALDVVGIPMLGSVGLRSVPIVGCLKEADGAEQQSTAPVRHSLDGELELSGLSVGPRLWTGCCRQVDAAHERQKQVVSDVNWIRCSIPLAEFICTQ